MPGKIGNECRGPVPEWMARDAGFLSGTLVDVHAGGVAATDHQSRDRVSNFDLNPFTEVVGVTGDGVNVSDVGPVAGRRWGDAVTGVEVSPARRPGEGRCVRRGLGGRGEPVEDLDGPVRRVRHPR